MNALTVLKVEVERQGFQFDDATDAEFVLKFPDHFLHFIQVDKGVRVAWRKLNEPANFLSRTVLETRNEKVISSPGAVLQHALEFHHE